MEICEIWIKNFQQFKNIHIDLTNPETGEPVSKVCFIGGNGTGKTTLLNLVIKIIRSEGLFPNNIKDVAFAYRIKFGNSTSRMVHACIFGSLYYLKDDVVNDKAWFDELVRANMFSSSNKLNHPFKSLQVSNDIQEKNVKYINELKRRFSLEEGWDSLYENPFHSSNRSQRKHNLFEYIVINSPSETDHNSYMFDWLPETNMNEALKLNKEFPLFHEVSNKTIKDFWKMLIYNIKKREEERNEFENLPENLDKSKRELIEEFDSTNPNIENKLAVLWNKILENAGLELDLENIKKPTQLTDNLQAFIRLKSTGEKIEYHQLSTGVRNFIFRIGHIFSLYFNREIKSGFLLVDEPENSLFPDFLFDLMETYDEIVRDKNGKNNTQMFFATHNPIVAAQFEPYERIILEWDEKGSVIATKGLAPVGDDPNDLLYKDFGLSHVMGKKGQEAWNKYLGLKKKLRRMKEEEGKEKLISEINEIGTKKNELFGACYFCTFT